MSKPTTRVLALLELLQAHGRMTGAELARRLEVDIRTVRRYINTLEELGIPVTTEQGRYGGYLLVAGFKLPPLMFTDEETLAISLGLLAARQLGMDDVAPAVAGVQAKLERVMPAKLKQRVRAVSESIKVVLPPAEGSRDSRALLALTEAAQSRQRVRFDYCSEHGEATRRELDPYGLVYRRGRWYVCGFCHLRGELRTFRLDRLGGAEVLAETFVRPRDFDASDYLHKSLLMAPRPYPVRVLLHTDAASIAEVFTGIEALLQQQEDGLLLRTSTDSYQEFARWLACLPFPLTILEPEELNTALRDQARRLLAIADGRPAGLLKNSLP